MNKVKKIVKKIVGMFMIVIPLRNVIVLESNPDMADNTYALFKRMIEREYNKKYKFIWLVKDVNACKNKCKIDNVYFEEIKPQTTRGMIKRIWILFTSRFIISSHSYIDKKRNGQVVVALGHGTPIKSVSQYFMMGDDCDFTLCPSESLISSFCKELRLKEKHMFVCGYPRNDMLRKSSGKLAGLLDAKYDKVIVWLPTFRQHSDKNRVDSEFNFPIGIPIIYGIKELEEINNFLKERNVLMMLKLHPAQDTSIIKAATLSNFILLSDKMISDAGAQLYEVLADTDALITDYSSVYCDYLLLNKPIAITLDDFKEYYVD